MYATTCCCSDPDCRLNGCKMMRPSPVMSPPFGTIGIIHHTPVGCVCPPTSEQTCQNSDCPRQDVKTDAR